MSEGKLVEFEIREFSIKVNNLNENYILYKAYSNKICGTHSFVQPLAGKFENTKCINGIPCVDTLSETKEECVESFLKELGVRAEVKLTIE